MRPELIIEPKPGAKPEPHPKPEHNPDSRRWTALTLLCLAQFMLIIDITAVNLALPSMTTGLSLSRQALTWVPAAYTLCFGGLLLLGGRLADGLGRRRAFLLGLAAFTVASLASGLSHSAGELIAGRAVQGVAAALLSPAALSILTTTFHGPERTKALGVWGAISGAGAAVGVLVGGALTSGPGWRWVFFVNLPIGLVVLTLLPRLVPAAAPARSLRGLDLPGALAATATAALLVYGLIHAGSTGWATAATLLPLAGAVVTAGTLVVLERSVKQPLLRPGLLRDRSVIAGTAVMFAATIILITGFFLISWYLQHRAGYSALKTGLVYLPVAVATGLGAHLASHSVGHLGFRSTACAGFTLAAVGALLLTRLPASGNAALAVLPGFILLSAGVGMALVTATTVALHQADQREAGVVSALVNTGHELGSALGVALASVLAASSLGTAATGVGGFRTAFALAAGIALAAAVAALGALPAGRPDPAARPVFGR
ncbi:MFS transporter [Catenulispora sp. NL8]|uniref:MFS transporter n=1 Tax=Catenulispora pinistramenti TaxID=2705254 RepID=A0ABS5KZK6_9ACTN|nr:MFS transporter [Catenulispora pinistramenti]MBS2551340.1 MFS transporter [Catenulispora pinistramenti]